MERRSLWTQSGWPQMRVDLGALSGHLIKAAFQQGEVAGTLRSLSIADCRSLERNALRDAALATAALADQPLRVELVDAWLDHLVDLAPEPPEAADSPTIGVVALTVDSRRHARSLLTMTRLQRWQRELVGTAAPASPSGPWRSAADSSHALPVDRIDADLQAYLIALTRSAEPMPLVRAALAYLQFAAIRPFTAGNGRIGRAIADMVIGRGTAAVAPLVSLSRQMLEERTAYEAALDSALSGDLDVTPWAAWFIDCHARATAHTLRAIDERLRVGKFWRDTAGIEMNSRQRRVLERFLSENAPEKISSRTYSAIAQTSTDSAQRDLADLAKKHIIIPNDGKARKTSYRLRDDFFIRQPDEIAAPAFEEASAAFTEVSASDE